MGKFRAPLRRRHRHRDHRRRGVVPPWTARRSPAGRGCRCGPAQELKIGMAKGPGFRIYLAIWPAASTCPSAGLPRHLHDGRAGRPGRSRAEAAGPASHSAATATPRAAGRRLAPGTIPAYGSPWEVEAMGPQADPDFLTADDWRCSSPRTGRSIANSNRAGPRLDGPLRLRPQDGRHRRRPPLQRARRPLPARRHQPERRRAGDSGAGRARPPAASSSSRHVSAAMWKLGQCAPARRPSASAR